MVDWVAHYDAIYATLGVTAQLTLTNTAADTFDLTVIDKTAGVEFGDILEVHTIKPAADVRMSELETHGLTRADVNGATLTFNGASWTVKTHALRPAPTGESAGELRMILVDE